MTLIGFIVVGLNGCIPMQVSSPEGALSFEDGTNRSPAATQISLGKKIWMNSCANCHTNESTGFPNKLYASQEDIRNGLVNIENMKYLESMMSDEYIEAVYTYLNVEAIEEIQKSKGNNIVSH